MGVPRAGRNKARSAYRSCEKGLFANVLESGEFGEAPTGVEVPTRRNTRPDRPVLATSFGELFLLDKPPQSVGLMLCVDACGHNEPDIMRELLAFNVLTLLANIHAEGWCHSGTSIRRRGWPPIGHACGWPA